MAKSMKNMVLLAKLQPVINVDALPTPADNAILVSAFTPSPINAEFVERNVIRGYKGNFGSLAVGVHRMFEFEVEIAGSGAAGTAPKWAPLLRMCGFSETLTAATSAVYQPVSSGEDMGTLYGYLDGILFKMLNCKGTVSFDFAAKQIPKMKFKVLGEYSEPTDAVFPSGAVFTGFQKPLTVGKINTPTFTIGALALCCNNLSFDIANNLVYRDLIGCGGPFSSDRKPTGNATVELPTTAAFNFAEMARLGTEVPLQLVHGLVPGNIVQIDEPKIQLTSAPTISSDNEIAMVGLQYSINPNAGNDELVVTVK